MTKKKISVRHIELNDLKFIVDYFLRSDTEFLLRMGVDISKLPTRKEWLTILTANFHLPTEQKKFFYIIWLMDNEPVGHCNINQILPGNEAYMHLHLWRGDIRQKGMGTDWVKMTLPYFFHTYDLKKLYCEPFALNPAPNKTLEKVGFDFIKGYETTPGWINSYQLVNRWCLTEEKFKILYSPSY